MPKKSFRKALNEALKLEMERDERVIVIGEDEAGGTGAPGEQDAWGGPLGVTKRLLPLFAPERVIDTAITESAFIGAAAGAAVSSSSEEHAITPNNDATKPIVISNLMLVFNEGISNPPLFIKNLHLILYTFYLVKSKTS